MAVDKPLHVPNGFEGALGNFGDDGFEVRCAESAEAGLGAGVEIRIGWAERGVEVDKDEAGVEVGFEENVDVDVSPEAAAIAHVLRAGVDLTGGEGPLAILRGEPGILVGEVVDAGNISAEELIDRDGAIIEGLEEELGDVGTEGVAGSEAAEKILRGDRMRAAEGGESV